MKKHYNEDIGLEATLPVEITKLLIKQKNLTENQVKYNESTAYEDFFLDEYELAMIS